VRAETTTVLLCRDEPLSPDELSALVGQPIATPQAVEVGTVQSARNVPVGVEVTVLLHPAIQATLVDPLGPPGDPADP